MDMEFGKELKGTRTLESGETQRPKVMEFTFGTMETDMRENGKAV